MSNQKFKRGNLVKVLYGHPMWTLGGGKQEVQDIDPSQVGRKAIIEYSYGEKFGGENYHDYSIVWQDTGGSLAWKHENSLEFLEEGGEHLLTEASKIRDNSIKQDTDLNYIVKNWEPDGFNKSSTTIDFLLNRIGGGKLWRQNGEYYTLYNSWRHEFPIIQAIMRFETIEKIFTGIIGIPEDRKPLIEKLFNEVKEIQKYQEK